MKEETFAGRGGTRLHMRSWRAEDLLNDPDKEAVIADLIAWIDARLS